MFKRIIVAALLCLPLLGIFRLAHGAGSSINPAIPAQGSLVSSEPLHANFLAAYNDINALIEQNAGPVAPLLPLAGQQWLHTGVSPYALYEYDGAAWVMVGSLDPVNHVWSCAVASGCTGLAGVGAAGNVLTSNGTSWVSAAPLPAPAVASANGFAGTLSNASTAPSITLSTTQHGILQGVNGSLVSTVAGYDYSAGTANLPTGMLKSTAVSGALSIGVPGVDYSAGTAVLGTGIVKSAASTGALSIAVAGTDYLAPSVNATVSASETFSGTANFTGAFEVSGTAQAFPASGQIVGASDAQTLSNKSIAGSEINSGTVAANYLPTATASAKGVVQTDGTTISNASGTISCSAATASQLGCVKPDGVSIVASGGVISTASSLVGHGMINGFGLANDATSPNTVLDIAPGMAADSTNAAYIVGTAFTKATGGAWVAGSGGNGMGSGVTLTAGTWYHVFAIVNNGAFDVYFDTSATAANRPPGTSYFRYIGSFKTTSGSTAIQAFYQFGQRFLWAAAFQDLASGTAATPTNITVSTPPGVVTYWLGTLTNTAAGGAGSVYVGYPGILSANAYEVRVVSSNTADYGDTTYAQVTTNTASQIAYMVSVVGPQLTLWTAGYIDPHVAPVF